MNRRRFVHWLSTLPLWELLGKRALAQGSSLSTAEVATLHEVAGVVLPQLSARHVPMQLLLSSSRGSAPINRGPK